jgi:hypothetical protein
MRSNKLNFYHQNNVLKILQTLYSAIIMRLKFSRKIIIFDECLTIFESFCKTIWFSFHFWSSQYDFRFWVWCKFPCNGILSFEFTSVFVWNKFFKFGKWFHIFYHIGRYFIDYCSFVNSNFWNRIQNWLFDILL